MVLPPLVEWLRVATVFTETRFSTNVEKDDVFQVSCLGLKMAINCPQGSGTLRQQLFMMH